MYFLNESYGNSLFNEMLGRLCFYCHTSGSEVMSESEVVVELLPHHRFLSNFKSKMLISNLIFFIFLGDKFLISAAPIMLNKLSPLGTNRNDLLMSSIISNCLRGFSGACWTPSLRFFALLCLCHKISKVWLVETFKNNLFLDQSVMLSPFGLISVIFVFGKLLTEFSLTASPRKHIF